MASAISYTINKNVSVLTTSNSGWTKEINLVSWNGRDPKYDIRDWDPAHEKMGKGITLSADEARAVAIAILEDLGELPKKGVKKNG